MLPIHGYRPYRSMWGNYITIFILIQAGISMYSHGAQYRPYTALYSHMGKYKPYAALLANIQSYIDVQANTQSYTAAAQGQIHKP